MQSMILVEGAVVQISRMALIQSKVSFKDDTIFRFLFHFLRSL